jgi:hypothetical protein
VPDRISGLFVLEIRRQSRYLTGDLLTICRLALTMHPSIAMPASAPGKKA